MEPKITRHDEAGDVAMTLIEVDKLRAVRAHNQACINIIIDLLTDAGALTCPRWADRVEGGMVACTLQEDHIDTAMELVGRAYVGEV